ncbi:sugar porter family MFS transporter [Halalkalicoccus ordinarius]|uniref:sugar porter family MFS transporter n=1 Tax=Halalkalicoccus ordinarius TaxID=3116651 RepID=UPI00300EC371
MSTRNGGGLIGGDDTNRFVYVTAALAALNGLLFGFDTGVISGALLYIGETFPLLEESAAIEGIVVSGALVGAAIGAAIGGRLADVLGRRRLILVAAVIFFVGSLGMATAQNVWWLITARIVNGVAIGFASIVGPLYISEIAPPRIRGSLVSFNQLAITSGILVSYLVNYSLASQGAWRLMLGAGMIPALVLLVGMYFMPESPRWLVGEDRQEEARSTLERIRTATGVEEEIEEIERMEALEEEGITEVFKPWIRPALIVGAGLAVFQQVTGINTVIYYAPTILESTGFGGVASILATVGIGVINVTMTVVAVLLLDRIGRRPLLLAGLGGMLATLLVLGGAFYLPGLGGVLGYVATGSLMLYVAFFAIGLGPVFWLLISEIYPLNVRGTAMGVATVVNWLANLVVAQLFPQLFDTIGPALTFWLFAGLTAGAIVFTHYLVPETKGRSLEEIEAHLRETAVGDESLSMAERAPDADD